MSLQDNKINIFAKRVSDLPNRPGSAYSASDVKGYFDSSPEELRLALNAVIDNLLSQVGGQSGAENIGSAPIAGLSGTSVYAQLSGVEAQIQSLVAGVLPPGTVTNAMLQDGALTLAKLDTMLKTATVAGLLRAHSAYGGL